ERLAFPGFRSLLGALACPLVAIDEAHCISEWGHDFRPEYLEIGGLLGELPGARVLACTATATPIVRDEILARLGLPSDTPQIVSGFARPNLALRAEEIDGRRERERLVDAALAEALAGPGGARGTAIVYAPTRKQADEESARLTARGWRARSYHAGLDGKRRDVVQREFAEGRLEVVVATNAFGMGIDRPDVRAVIHLGPPGSIEAYYQEVGRAGRDGAPALGLLLISTRDLPLRRALLERGVGDTTPDPAVIEHKWSMFLELIRWAEGGSCRHDAILRYFGDEAETLAGCGRCDVCLALEDEPETGDPEQVTLIVRKALSGVARVDGRFGLQLAVMKGERPARLLLPPMARRAKLASGALRAGTAEHATAPAVEPATDRASARGARREPAELDAAGLALFEALRRHRLTVARAERVAPFIVASDRTLRDIAMLRPRDLVELERAHGVGPHKAAKYGAGLVKVVAESVEPRR